MCVDAIATVATVAVVGVAFAGVDNVGSAMGSAGASAYHSCSALLMRASVSVDSSVGVICAMAADLGVGRACLCVVSVKYIDLVSLVGGRYLDHCRDTGEALLCRTDLGVNSACLCVVWVKYIDLVRP